MRALQFVLFVALVVLVLVTFSRPRVAARRRASGPGPLDELVKDPVCAVYVVRSRAVTRQGLDGPVYFCSDACARRYKARAQG